MELFWAVAVLTTFLRQHILKILYSAAKFCLPLMIFAVPITQSTELIRIEVALEGIHGDIKENVTAFLRQEQFAVQKDIKEQLSSIISLERNSNIDAIPADEVAARIDQGIMIIRKAMAPFGYEDPQVESKVEQTEDVLTVTYRIDPGPATQVANLYISISGAGQSESVLTQSVADFPLRVGDIFNDIDYEKGKNKILRVAQEAGFLDARWDQSVVQIRREQRQADIVLALATGPRFHFGPTHFTVDILREEVLRRYLPYADGDLFAQDKLLELQSSLYDSDYFASVQVKAQREQIVDDAIPIHVDLKPQPKRQYTAGAGYATDTGPRASFGLKVRRVNDLGHRFRTRYRWSEIKQSAEAVYTLLGDRPRTDFLEISGGWSDEKILDGEEETYILGLSQTKGLSAEILQTIYLNFSVESYVLGPDTGKTQLLTPGIRWTWRRSDAPDYPHRGIRWTLDVRGTDPALWSDAEFLQFQTSLKGVRSITDKTRILARVEAGRTFVSALSELPPSMRLFAGGDQSVRGYDHQQLSEGGLGGTHLLVGSLEVEQRIANKWYGAIFSDAGNAMQDWNAALEQGVGLGGRWLSPIGPVRLDVAWAISEPGSPYRVHFTLGPDL